jgi:hypothetical protein
MRRAIALLVAAAAALVGLSGCGDNTQAARDGFRNMLIAAGYDVTGEPKYDDTQGAWVVEAGIKDCEATLEVVAGSLPASHIPTSFEVRRIDGTLTHDIYNGAPSISVSASVFRGPDEIEERLRCHPSTTS